MRSGKLLTYGCADVMDKYGEVFRKEIAFWVGCKNNIIKCNYCFIVKSSNTFLVH